MCTNVDQSAVYIHIWTCFLRVKVTYNSKKNKVIDSREKLISPKNQSNK